MLTVFYPDVYFALNWLMDLTALSVASLVTGEPLFPVRLFLSALLGATVSLALFFLSPSAAVDLIAALLCAWAMIRLAFGKKTRQRTLRLGIFFLLTALLMGGLARFLSYYLSHGTGWEGVTLGVTLLVMLTAFLGFSLWGKKLHRRMQSAVVHLSVLFRGRREETCALVDSGAFLQDPVSGDPVLLMKADSVAAILKTEELIRLEREGVADFPLSEIPLLTAAGKKSLLAFRAERVKIYGGKRHTKEIDRILIALDFSGGGFAGCPCLIPLCIL